MASASLLGSQGEVLGSSACTFGSSFTNPCRLHRSVSPYGSARGLHDRPGVHLHVRFPAIFLCRHFLLTFHRYAAESTQDFICRHAHHPSQIKSFASAETADSLARAALARSVHLLTSQASDMCQLVNLKGACGVGATAALASKTWKRGDHRLFVALSGYDLEVQVSVTLFKACARV